MPVVATGSWAGPLEPVTARPTGQAAASAATATTDRPWFIPAAVDDHSRLAYAEIHADETAQTAAGFLTRAQAWFAQRGVVIQRVLTDNGGCYRSHQWHQACQQLKITAKRTRPLSAANQRQGRAVQPHPGGRLGVSAAVSQRSRPPSRVRTLAALVYPPPAPQRPRTSSTNHPLYQPPRALHLVDSYWNAEDRRTFRP
jgi:Integrase core domain